MSSDASENMKFGLIHLLTEISSIDARFSYNWKLFLPSHEFCFFARLHFVVTKLSILSPDAFQKSSHVNTEQSKQSDWVLGRILKRPVTESYSGL